MLNAFSIKTIHYLSNKLALFNFIFLNFMLLKLLVISFVFNI